jgi:hypothetical protein
MCSSFALSVDEMRYSTINLHFSLIYFTTPVFNGVVGIVKILVGRISICILNHFVHFNSFAGILVKFVRSSFIVGRGCSCLWIGWTKVCIYCFSSDSQMMSS